MNVDQHLGKADILPQFGSRKPRNNSEITTAEQRDNSTGAAIKKQHRGRNIPTLGWTSLKCHPILLRSYGRQLGSGGRGVDPDCSVRLLYHNDPNLSSIKCENPK